LENIVVLLQTQGKLNELQPNAIVLENVALMAASQITTICFMHFGNHQIPLQLQTTPPDVYLLLKKIQLFPVPQELQPFQPF